MSPSRVCPLVLVVVLVLENDDLTQSQQRRAAAKRGKGRKMPQERMNRGDTESAEKPRRRAERGRNPR
jgi:hypothetical protein